MSARERLEIRGFRGRRVPHTWTRASGDARADHLALVFPGRAYSVQGPACYYPAAAAACAGADVLAVDYRYDRLAGFADLPDDEQERVFTAEITAALDAALAGAPDGVRLALIGKSLGTRAVVHLLAEHPRAAGADAILLTPVLGYPPFRDRLAALPAAASQGSGRRLSIIGTADPHYSADNVELARAVGDVLVLDGADHALDIPGDPVASVQLLARIVGAARALLSR